MNRLIAIPSCHRYASRCQLIRETWGAKCAEHGFDLRFFVGDAAAAPDAIPPMRPQWENKDVVYLAVPDGYAGLPLKIQKMCAWAHTAGYEQMFRTDDDCYVVPEMLKQLPVQGYDYVGRFRRPSGGYPAMYSSGFAYWLSRRAMKEIMYTPLNQDWAEDRVIGNLLAMSGIQGHSDLQNYSPVAPTLKPELICRCNVKFCSVFCEFHDPAEFREMHRYNSQLQKPANMSHPQPTPVTLAKVTPEQFYKDPADAPHPRYLRG